MRKKIKGNLNRLPSLSLIVDTFNEENNIDGCLKTLFWVDEIIVIDMYSSDRTLDIAKKYTDKIYFYQQCYYVEPARNFAIRKATKDWNLIIDADESLPQGSEKIIRKLVENKNIDGYWFPRRAYINDHTYLKHGYFYPDYQLRLFRNNGKIRYSGKIHEQPMIPKEKTKIINDVEIDHNTSHCKYDSIFHFYRFFRYIPIEGNELNKSDVKTLNLLYLIPLDFFRHIYRSFIKLEGFKDGYPGFRAAVIFAMYKTCVDIFALFYRIKKIII